MRILGTIASSSREVPNAPTIGTATDVGTSRTYTPQNGGATVTFTAPTWTGGLPILDYTVTSSPGSFTATGAGSPLTVNGLAPSTLYSFTVKARNSVGLSAASAASNSITATTVPAAPTIGTATATGGTTATVAFTAGATGGKTITSYTATSSPGGITASGATSPITVTGLATGTAYTFTVTASNANGTSLASGASNSVTPVSPNYLNTLGYGNNIGYVWGELDSTASTSYAIGRISVSGATGALIAAYNSTGVLQWQRNLGVGSGLTVPPNYTTGAIDSSGNIYAIAYEVVGANYDWLVVKYNSSGTILWQKSYRQGGSISGSPYAATLDSSGNLFVVGDNDGTGYIYKIDSSGTLLISKSLQQLSRGQELKGVQVDSSGNVYTVGWGQTSTSGATQCSFIHKLDSTLTTLWTRQYQVASVSDQFNSLYTDTSGNSYAAGLANLAPQATTFVKYDTSGNLQWQRYITSGFTQSAVTPLTGLISYDSSGNIYLLTGNPNSSAGNSQANIFKYNTSGTLQWQRSLTGSLNISKINVKGNNFYVYGTAAGNGAFTFNAPIDGSKTGTYVLNGISYTYAASSFTDAAGSATSNTVGPYATGTVSPTTTTTTLTAATPTYTSTTTTY
jgi:hypothetical protein